MLLEKAMATYSSTLAWKIPWTEEPGRLQSLGLLWVWLTEQLRFHFSLSCIGEGNGSPLHCSCLENPRDGGAWWAAIYGVTQSWTQLKRLSSSSSSYVIIQYYILSLFCVSTKTQHSSHLLWSILREAIISWLWASLYYLAGHIKNARLWPLYRKATSQGWVWNLNEMRLHHP